MIDRTEKARRAKAIFEDEVFKEAISVVIEYHNKTFMRAKSTKDEVLAARERILALTEVTNQLVKFMADEKMANEREEKHRGRND